MYINNMTRVTNSANHIIPLENRLALLLAACSAIIFAVLAWYVISYGHPHEDAYILFIYSESLADFGYISFYDSGPNAEGATDFLWMILISLQNSLGIPSFIASSLLNSIGCFIISYLILCECSRHGSWTPVGIVFATFVPFYSISQASLGGFSASLYAAVSLGLFFLLFRGSSQSLTWLPFLSITIGLFRPDGVILGVVATIIGFFIVGAGHRRKLFRNAVIAACIGVIYFGGRWWYFGEFLPLPIYVKGDTGSRFAGLKDNVDWANLNILLLLAFVISFFSPSINKRRYIFAAIPAMILVFVFTFFHQSQNLSYRFHAPASALLLLGVAIAAVFVLERVKIQTLFVRFSVILLLIAYSGYHFFLHMRLAVATVNELTNADYINFFPFMLREDISEDTSIALTEAGRFAYWLDGVKFDLVGLNTAETARFGASPEYLESIAPDILFFHVAGTLKYTCQTSKRWCEIQDAEFLALVDQRRPRSYSRTLNRVRRAPLAAYEFLSNNLSGYRIFFVQETIDERRADFRHVYAIKTNGRVDILSFLDTLTASFEPSNRMSYLAMECELGVRPFLCGSLTFTSARE